MPPQLPFREPGFTIVEVIGATLILVTGLTSIAAVLLSISAQREQATLRSLVLRAATQIVEEIKETPPRDLVDLFDDRRFPVEGVMGPDDGNDIIHVKVDDASASLLLVTVEAEWNVASLPESLVLYTEIYDTTAGGRP